MQLTVSTEVEERRERRLVRQSGSLLAEFVEEGMQTGLEGTQALGGRVVEQLRHQLDGLR